MVFRRSTVMSASLNHVAGKSPSNIRYSSFPPLFWVWRGRWIGKPCSRLRVISLIAHALRRSGVRSSTVRLLFTAAYYPALRCTSSRYVAISQTGPTDSQKSLTLIERATFEWLTRPHLGRRSTLRPYPQSCTRFATTQSAPHFC